MKTIDQGRYEIAASKTEAIARFRQLDMTCREELGNDNPLAFYCSQKGKIVLTGLPRRGAGSGNATELVGEIVEQDGKTYVTYVTAFRKDRYVLKLVSSLLFLLLAILAIVLAVLRMENLYSLAALVLCLLFFGYSLFAGMKEAKRSPADAQILVVELENRVNAVNLWDN